EADAVHWEQKECYGEGWGEGRDHDECMQEGVHSFPTVRFYSKSGKKFADFTDERTPAKLLGFAEQHATPHERPAPLEETRMEQPVIAALTPAAPTAAAAASPVKVIEYLAKSCPHCQSMEPLWKDAQAQWAAKAANPKVQWEQKECFAQGWVPGKDLEECKRSNIEGFPTLKIFGGTSPAAGEEFSGPRSVPNILSWVHLGVPLPRALDGDSAPVHLLPPHKAFNWIQDGSVLVFDVTACSEGNKSPAEVPWRLQEGGPGDLVPYGFATLLSDLPDEAKATVFETFVDDFFGPSEVPELAIVFDRQQQLETARQPGVACPPGQAMAQWILRNKARPHQVFLVDRDEYAKKYQRLQDAAAGTERLTFPSEIVEDGLYLGPLQTATSSAVLNGLAITHVLSVIDHSDHPSADLYPVLKKALPWMLAAFAETPGARLLVHCAQGRSRSGSVVIAWLMCVKRVLERDEKSGSPALFRAVMGIVKHLRPSIQPNYGFACALENLFHDEGALAPLLMGIEAFLKTPGGRRWQLALG
ncbi:true, partial [Symbiodinium sp. CCMP2456]